MDKKNLSIFRKDSTGYTMFNYTILLYTLLFILSFIVSLFSKAVFFDLVTISLGISTILASIVALNISKVLRKSLTSLRYIKVYTSLFVLYHVSAFVLLAIFSVYFLITTQELPLFILKTAIFASGMFLVIPYLYTQYKVNRSPWVRYTESLGFCSEDYDKFFSDYNLKLSENSLRYSKDLFGLYVEKLRVNSKLTKSIVVYNEEKALDEPSETLNRLDTTIQSILAEEYDVMILKQDSEMKEKALEKEETLKNKVESFVEDETI